jgi:hypothetical protein
MKTVSRHDWEKFHAAWRASVDSESKFCRYGISTSAKFGQTSPLDFCRGTDIENLRLLIWMQLDLSAAMCLDGSEE